MSDSKLFTCDREDFNTRYLVSVCKASTQWAGLVHHCYDAGGRFTGASPRSNEERPEVWATFSVLDEMEVDPEP